MMRFAKPLQFDVEERCFQSIPNFLLLDLFSKLTIFKMSSFFQPFVALVSTFLRPLAGIQFEISSFSEV